ncbi:MAG TPA: phosphoribosyl-ATP diphosphatase [Methanocorpusculum sp.]|nr:phosphoribosyl-ATP diphosphatase [Methanocorpusculum sp.]
MTNASVFDELWQVICQRAESQSPEKSYVRHLLFHEKGIDKPLEKVGEEATEFILACKNGTEDRIVEEAADVLFHLMVALKAAGVDFEKIEEELHIRRQGMHLHD